MTSRDIDWKAAFKQGVAGFLDPVVATMPLETGRNLYFEGSEIASHNDTPRHPYFATLTINNIVNVYDVVSLKHVAAYNCAELETDGKGISWVAVSACSPIHVALATGPGKLWIINTSSNKIVFESTMPQPFQTSKVLLSSHFCVVFGRKWPPTATNKRQITLKTYYRDSASESFSVGPTFDEPLGVALDELCPPVYYPSQDHTQLTINTAVSENATYLVCMYLVTQKQIYCKRISSITCVDRIFPRPDDTLQLICTKPLVGVTGTIHRHASCGFGKELSVVDFGRESQLRAIYDTFSRQGLFISFDNFKLVFDEGMACRIRRAKTQQEAESAERKWRYMQFRRVGTMYIRVSFVSPSRLHVLLGFEGRDDDVQFELVSYKV
jgi:hypothetical protein